MMIIDDHELSLCVDDCRVRFSGCDEPNNNKKHVANAGNSRSFVASRLNLTHFNFQPNELQALPSDVFEINGLVCLCLDRNCFAGTLPVNM